MSAISVRSMVRQGVATVLLGGAVLAHALEPQIAAGGDHNCLLDGAGVRCWGDNALLQNKMPPLVNPVLVDNGGNHSCAIDDTGVKCWGNNTETSVPVLLDPVALNVGPDNTCVIDDNPDARLVCWGKNSSQLNKVPATVTNPSAVAVGANHACVIDGAAVECWGKNPQHGQDTPPALTAPTTIAAGDDHTCVIDSGTVKCWGLNADGQTAVPTLVNPVAIATGANHSCALDDNGVDCWGDNAFGQTNVPALANPVAIAAGAGHSCAIDDSGVVCWGDNGLGQVDAPALSPLVVTGINAKDYLGTAVAAAGDVDNDGFGDVIIGSPRFDALVPTTTLKLVDAGRAVVYSGLTGEVLIEVFGNSAKDYFGSSVAGIGDIDQDGTDDIAVGAVKDDVVGATTLVDAGCVYVYSGNYIDGDDPLLVACGDKAKQQFGNAIASGYVDADAAPDLVIGSWLDDKLDTVTGKVLLKDAGSVTVLSGADLTAPYTSLMKIYGTTAGAWAGFAVATGYVDADGNHDVIVGAPKDDEVIPGISTLKDAGTVKVYLDSYIDGDEPLFTVHGDSAKDYAGYSVAAADVDGSGYDDVVVGVPRDDYFDAVNAINYPDNGSVRVFDATGTEIVSSKAIGTPQAKGYLGWSVAATGDLDNDGNDDVMAGAYQYDVPNPAITGKLLKNAGRMTVFSGADGSDLMHVDGDSATDYYGAAVAAGDVTGDGTLDLIVGAPRDDRSALSATGKPVLVKDVGRTFVYSGKSAAP